MRKTTFVLSILAFIGSASFNSTAASLDVHGDIKINGKTVINAEGVFVESNTVNINDYFPTSSKVVTLAAIKKYYVDGSMVKDNHISKFHYEENGNIKKEETFINNELAFYTEWMNRTENSVDIVTNNEKVSIKFDKITNYPLVKLGATASRMERYVSTITESVDPEDIDKEIHFLDILSYTPIEKVNYTYGDGKVLNDCIVTTYEYIFNTEYSGSMKQARVLCKGIGTVSYNGYNLVSIEDK
ncbi:hypothetical protein [Photobacterium phosphoreum]|uniref:hypothetical protein n=1 Tax=Photobacterium phosphoreum TaxID=659 RepID=UPI0024B73B77|nr:hypothetical protein [Photobacterium phosphoreum]